MEDKEYYAALRISDLLHELITGEITADGRRELDALTGSEEETERLLGLILSDGPLTANMTMPEYLRDRTWRAISDKISKRSRLRRKIVAWSAGAAAALAAVVLLFTNPGTNTGDSEVPAVSGEEVKIVLSSGEEISMDAAKGEVRSEGVRIVLVDNIITLEESDDTIIDNPTLSFHTITTPPGKVYNIVMADGSKAIVNARSSLRFPSKFSSDERKVYLEGEAYFEAAHDEKRPFRVFSGGVSTTALGTEFAIRSYRGTEYLATLISGSVRVDNGTGSDVILRVGEQAGITEGRITVRDVDTEYFTGWTVGYFMFDNRQLVDIVREVAEWYGFEYRIDNVQNAGTRIKARIRRYENKSDIADIINEMDNLEVNDNTIVIK